MKRHIYILLIFAAILSLVQANNNKKAKKPTVSNSTENVCNYMRNQAIKDLKAGRYKLFEFGIVSSPDTNVQILKQIKIKLISGGCNVTDGMDCYRAIMDSAIKEKYRDKIIKCYSDGFNRIRFKTNFLIKQTQHFLAKTQKQSQRIYPTLMA